MFRRVYLDNSATTPVDEEVFDAMKPFLTETFGNASSIHFFGQQARAAVDKARHQVASLLGAGPREVVFTSGGTEGNNLAIRGIAAKHFPDGGHIITSAIEHPAVLAVCEKLAERGYELTIVETGSDGIVSAKDIEDAIRENTFLVSVMTANNEVGTIQPISEIGAIVNAKRETGQKIWFHTDAVQAAGKISLDVAALDCDLLTISGHKIYGPKGVGALYIRRGVRVENQNLGGHQERETRGGTENVSNIVALGVAAEKALAELGTSPKSVGELRDQFERFVIDTVPGTAVNGDTSNRLPNISNILFEHIEGEGLLINLDMNGIAVSTGSACSSGSIDPSPVIIALGIPEEEARGAVRFSFGKYNNLEDLEYLKEVVPKAVETLRSISPHYQSTSGS